MNFISFRKAVLVTALIVISASAKRPKKEKPPKEPRPALTQEQRQVIVENVAQVMGGICTLAQAPHNPHNIGNSVASIIQALITILVEKFARRNININDVYAVEQCLNELHEDINKEITEIITKKRL